MEKLLFEREKIMRSYSELRARSANSNSFHGNATNSIDLEEELDRVSPDQSILSNDTSKLFQVVTEEMSPIPIGKEEKSTSPIANSETKITNHNKPEETLGTKNNSKEELEEERVSFLISQKNKMLEEMSRRHENEIKMVQINSQQQQKQILAQYTSKIEELTKQMDVIKSRNRELEVKYEYQYNELQATKNTLTESQQQILQSKESENRLKVMLIETQHKLQEKDEHLQRQQALIFNLNNDLTRLQSQPPPLQQSIKSASSPTHTPQQTLEDFEKSPIKRIQHYKKTQELKKQEEENEKEMSKLKDKYHRAKSLIEALNNQKKELERKCNFITSNNETFNQRMNEIVLQVHTEAEKALLKASDIQKANEELKKQNQTLKQMNERYFLVLKALKEAEDKLTQKEMIIREMTNKYQELKKLPLNHSMLM